MAHHMEYVIEQWDVGGVLKRTLLNTRSRSPGQRTPSLRRRGWTMRTLLRIVLRLFPEDVVGILASLMPARRASRVDPVRAMEFLALCDDSNSQEIGGLPHGRVCRG